jgi:anti-anti-sigma factor
MADNDTETGPSKISVTKVGASSVLTPKESLTYQNCEDIQALAKGLLDQNKTRILLDCKTTDYFDSKALEFLIQLHEDLEKRGGILKITSLNAICRDILMATRLVNVLNVYEDIAEALRSNP